MIYHMRQLSVTLGCEQNYILKNVSKFGQIPVLSGKERGEKNAFSISPDHNIL